MKTKIGNHTHIIPAEFHNNASRCTIEILTKFPAVSQIWTVGALPDHNTLRCTDFMSFEDRKLGQAIADYAVKNAARLGVEYIAWNNRAWRDAARRGQPQGWGRLFIAGTVTATKQHRDHPHIQFRDKAYESPNPPKPVVYLPVYVVDPLKVETTLIGVDHKTKDAVKERPPEYRIDTGVKIVTVNGAKWLLTEKEIRYHMGYLVLESEFLKRPIQ